MALLIALYIPHFALAVLAPDHRQQPTLLLHGERVLDASDDALACGVLPGEDQRRARQRCPQAVVVAASVEALQARHQHLQAVLREFGLRLHTRGWGDILLDAGPLLRTWPSPADFAHALHQHLHAHADLPIHLGLASRPFTAQQAARRAAELQQPHVSVAPEQAAAFLAPLPLDCLPPGPDPALRNELLRRLPLLGIHTLGEFAALPEHDVRAQFGSDAAVSHRAASARDDAPLSPDPLPPSIQRTRHLPEALRHADVLQRHLAALCNEVSALLQQQGWRAAALSLTLHTDHGHDHQRTLALKPPSASSPAWQRRLSPILTDAPAPVEALSLRAEPLRPWHEGVRQSDLFGYARQRRLARLEQGLQRLQQRYGRPQVYPASSIAPPAPRPVEVQVDAQGQPRSLRMVRRHIPVRQVSAQWRQHGQWWADQPVARDYYRVETEQGATLNLYRDPQARWYVDRQATAYEAASQPF